MRWKESWQWCLPIRCPRSSLPFMYSDFSQSQNSWQYSQFLVKTLAEGRQKAGNGSRIHPANYTSMPVKIK